MRILTILVAIGIMASNALASITLNSVTTSSNDPNQTDAITNSKTGPGTPATDIFGNPIAHLMDGMKITATFADNSSEEITWMNISSTESSATGNGWKLMLTGNSYNSPWTLSTTSALTSPISSLFLDAGQGQAVFDIKPDFQTPHDSPGSAKGRLFTITDPSTGSPAPSNTGDATINVVYSGPVSVGDPAQFYGDLYRYMDVQFPTSFTGQLTFWADTDNSTAPYVPTTPPNNPPDNTPTTVPVPGALLLAGIGVACLRRKTSRK